MQTFYLAGPGVFRPDAAEWGRRLQQCCQAHDLVGLYPLDQAAPDHLNANDTAAWIFAENCQLIAQADAIFADVRSFRSSSEPDSGTAFEIGYARALGKPIILWLADVNEGQTLRDRIGAEVDSAGMSVEDFCAPLNLMLWHAAEHVIYATEPEEAIGKLSKYLINSTR
ncbi:nucleoside 2-deoxyribosyltransferase [Chitinibacter bivalviorum]|uniref:Nucleoside 2-deoxyribosyltransferase n=1 Tax=Chitinibacter bivalviorum TaxID=2739434 RepID=A0A7H9BLB6_9NEIS|nr:nucleoside 2-deoxyribosyltransferase [Chitinibacter bivalviorum]QLG89182.1 nucleoside 2-deoxyribosyltransferase [Chitinibacter bivalviorum]